MSVAAATRSGRRHGAATPGGDSGVELLWVPVEHGGDGIGTTADHRSLRFTVPRSSRCA
ncbi:hypothetical protein Hanom_Chr17g01585421 [Helianthus anomalus]